VQRQDAGHVTAIHAPQVHDVDSGQNDVSVLLLQSREQQRLQQIQQDQQRLLLQRSCDELQSEVKALQDALLSRQSELEMLRARVAEAEVPCLPAHLFLFS
jgi:molecular chaperone GrpE (heat shock protein)